MLNPSAYALGANRSCIRDLFEYGCRRAAVVGRENVYDYSLGNPSIPSPKEVDETVRQILDDTDSLLIHGYTSAVGDYATRKAISDDLNARYGVSTVPEEFFIGCGAAPELVRKFWQSHPIFRNTNPSRRRRGWNSRSSRRTSPPSRST